jgi:hypothetical protein
VPRSHSITSRGLNSSDNELEEAINVENSRREKEKKQNQKILFYEMCFNIKTKVFPDKHLAKYANIPALFEES